MGQPVRPGDPAELRPVGVSVIVVITLVGWLGMAVFWATLYVTDRIPSFDAVTTQWERSFVALVYGFSAADWVWTQLLSLAAIVGLWRLRAWGWTAAMMLNALWVYIMTFRLVHDLVAGVALGTAVFGLFGVYCLVATFYLWRKRALFGVMIS